MCWSNSADVLGPGFSDCRICRNSEFHVALDSSDVEGRRKSKFDTHLWICRVIGGLCFLQLPKLRLFRYYSQTGINSESEDHARY